MELRRRGFGLGSSEYLAALKALSAGFGLESPEALASACGTLWAKSRVEQLRIERLVLRALREQARRDGAPTDPAVAEPASETDERPPSTPKEERQRPEVGRPEPADSAALDTPLEVTVDLDRAGAADDDGAEHEIDLGQQEHVPAWEVNPDFELVPQQPVDPRRMKRAWRGYRRAGRAGPKTELDIDEALERIQRFGLLARLPMRAARMNRARLLVLIDAGGSMLPFRYMTEALLASIRNAGLGALTVRYFHDVPDDKVYRDPSRQLAQRLDQTAASFVDQGIVVYGDAGAARGTLDEARVEASTRVIDRLRGTTPTVVWLNPVPARRWRGTTAAAIRTSTEIPMYPLHEGGLRAAVSALHGKAG